MNAPASPTKQNKHSFVHKRAEHFLFPSKNLVIVGLDTDHVMGSHPLWRADAKKPPPQALVDSIRKHGILQPGKARKIAKDNFDTAEVVMGRDRTKALRILESEGISIPMPMLVWPAGTPIAEIVGAANAENFQRKNESLIEQVEHVWMQLVAEGYTNGNEHEAIKATALSCGFTPQRIRYMVALRGDADLHEAVKSGALRGESGLSLASIEDDELRAAELDKALANPDMTTSEIKERTGYAKASVRKLRANAPTDENEETSPRKSGPKGLPGIGKPLARRLVESQMALDADERDLDQLIIKVLKVTSGQSPVSTVPGLAKAMKRLGIET